MEDEHDYARTISRIRDVTDHPIVDADAHLVEPFPLILEELRDILGPTAEADFARSRYHTLYSSTEAWPPMSDEQRRRDWAVNAAQSRSMIALTNSMSTPPLADTIPR